MNADAAEAARKLIAFPSFLSSSVPADDGARRRRKASTGERAQKKAPEGDSGNGLWPRKAEPPSPRDVILKKVADYLGKGRDGELPPPPLLMPGKG